MAYCLRCHEGHCHRPPSPHTWVGPDDDPGVSWPLTAEKAAEFAAEWPCACDCAQPDDQEGPA